MIKKFLSIFIVLNILFITTFNALAYEPSAQQNINDNLVKYKQIGNEILSLNAEISTLNGQVSKIKENLKNSEDSINKIQIEIKDTHEKLEQSKKDIGREQSVLDNRLRAMYKNRGSQNYIELLLTSTTVTSFLSRVSAISKVIFLDKNLIAKLDYKKQQLNNNIQELAIKENNIKQIKISTETNLKDLQEKQQTQNKLIDNLNKEKMNIASIIQSNEESLVAHPISVINSEKTTTSELKNAITSLQQLLQQLNTQSVKEKIQSSINTGTTKLSAMSSSNTNTSQDENVKYKATLNMTSTAYCGGTLTALGLKPIRSASGISTVAVDSNVIPLGSKVYIPNYGYGIASDTGSSIKGNIIDLYMNSENECYSWGRRGVVVHIISYPGEW